MGQHHGADAGKSGVEAFALTLADRQDLVGNLISAVVADELGKLRKAPVSPLEQSSWTADMALTEDGLGFDSLALLELVSRFNHMFGLHKTGVEDYLFIRPQLGEWTDLLCYHLKTQGSALDLRIHSSGSTADPTPTSHSLGALFEEVQALAELFDPVDRVISTVPCHHIYGLLFAVLVPAYLRIPVMDQRHRGPGSILSGAGSGDLIVGTPFTWSILTKAGSSPRGPINGVVSGAPMPLDLWPLVEALGVARLVEIYGSTETGGVGARQAHCDPFQLMGHLRRSRDQIRSARDGRRLDLQDDLVWHDATSFDVVGRKDKVVQIGGTNVSLAHVANHLSEFADISQAVVRPDGHGASMRLKALVVPSDVGVNHDQLRARLRSHISQLPGPARPHAVSIGPKIPRSDLGKAMDWDPMDYF